MLRISRLLCNSTAAQKNFTFLRLVWRMKVVLLPCEAGLCNAFERRFLSSSLSSDMHLVLITVLVSDGVNVPRCWSKTIVIHVVIYILSIVSSMKSSLSAPTCSRPHSNWGNNNSLFNSKFRSTFCCYRSSLKSSSQEHALKRRADELAPYCL